MQPRALGRLVCVDAEECREGRRGAFGGERRRLGGGERGGREEEEEEEEEGRSSCGEREGGTAEREGGAAAARGREEQLRREARPARGRYGEMRRGDMARGAPGEGETAKRSASRSENSRCTSLKERTRGIAGEALSLATSASDTRDEKKRCALAYAGAFGLRKSSMRRPSDSTDGVRK